MCYINHHNRNLHGLISLVMLLFLLLREQTQGPGGVETPPKLREKIWSKWMQGDSHSHGAKVTAVQVFETSPAEPWSLLSALKREMASKKQGQRSSEGGILQQRPLVHI